MISDAFISYSHVDRSYIDRLVIHLANAGIPVWYDYKMQSGARFDRVIDDRIRQCGAFLVVMTPAGFDSDWVINEVARAQQLRKPILPLLLAGQPFLSLSSRDYENVVGGIMPSYRFMRTLQEHLGVAATNQAEPLPSELGPPEQTFNEITLDPAAPHQAPTGLDRVTPPNDGSAIKQRQRAAVRARLEREMAERADAARTRRRAQMTLGISKLFE
jgi:hypothetical protein